MKYIDFVNKICNYIFCFCFYNIINLKQILKGLTNIIAWYRTCLQTCNKYYDLSHTILWLAKHLNWMNVDTKSTTNIKNSVDLCL